MRPLVPAHALTHRRPPEPLFFPVEEQVPETRDHFLLRILLFQILHGAFREHATVGSDQFVYWNASNPRRCLAPDAFVRLGAPDRSFDSWKTWERGAPELCVEIVSRSDAGEPSWEEKLSRYHELGVTELVRFDAAEAEAQRLRVWDRLDGDLVERVVTGDRAASTQVGGTWVVAPGSELEHALRLLDEHGRLRLTAEEAGKIALDQAGLRIAELEAELRRRG